MKEQCGASLTIGEKGVVRGSYQQVYIFENLLHESLGLHRREADGDSGLKNMTPSAGTQILTTSEPKGDSLQWDKEGEVSDELSAISQKNNLDKSPTGSLNPLITTPQHTCQTQATKGSKKDAVKKHHSKGSLKYPGKALQQTQTTQTVLREQTTDLQGTQMTSVKQQGNVSKLVTNSNAQVENAFQDQQYMSVDNGNLDKLPVKRPPLDEQPSTPAFIQDQAKAHKTTSKKTNATRSANAQISSTENTKFPTQDQPNECAQVDSVIFQYIKTVRKEDYDGIESKFGVSISAKPIDPLNPTVLIVEVRQAGQVDKRNDPEVRTSQVVLMAQTEFINLFSDTYTNFTSRSLDCSGVSLSKLKRAKTMIHKRFKNVLLIEESDTTFVFCGKESNVVDAMNEFRTTASINDETCRHLSVDKVAFQYLKHCKKDQLDAIGKQYHVYLELKETASNSHDSQDLFIKPQNSGKQKKKITEQDIEDAKEMLISLYQKNCIDMKRVKVTCQGVSEEKIKEAMKETQKSFTNVLILKQENVDCLICGEEIVLQEAVKNFRRLAGISPIGRKLKKTNSSESAGDNTGNTLVQSGQRTSLLLDKEKTGGAGSAFTNATSGLESSFFTKEGLQITVLTGDITQQKVDVIVNAANGRLKHKGGVAKALANAAGPQLQAESDRLMSSRSELQIGECVSTNGYNLHCDIVVHTVGPVFNKKLEDVEAFVSYLELTFFNVLMYVDGLKRVRSIALPLISSGTYGGPTDACTEALTTALSNFSKVKERNELKEIFLVNIDPESTLFLQKKCNSRFPPTPADTKSSGVVKPNLGVSQTTKTLMTKEGLQIIISTGDITTLEVHAIVNAANGHLRHGRGVAAAISRAAGHKLTEEGDQLIARRKRPLQVGEVAETGAYNLPCKSVIHAVGPRYKDFQSEDMFYAWLKHTFIETLRYANTKTEASSVALPLISSGIFGGPKDICSKALLDAVKEFSENENTLIIKVLHLINLDEKATRAIEEAFHIYTTPEGEVSSQPLDDGGYQYVTAEGIQLYVEQGDITRVSADAIVNPTDHCLSHAGGVSKAILKKAGDKFKNDCQEKMKHRSHLQPNEVIHTSGGALPCKFVLNVISPFFNKTRPHSEYEEALQKAITACLRTANHSLKLTSVALPLMGSGRNAAPIELATNSLAQAIASVSCKETTLRLKQISVICMDEMAVHAVNQAFEKPFQCSRSLTSQNLYNSSKRNSTIDMDQQVSTASTIWPTSIHQNRKTPAKISPSTSGTLRCQKCNTLSNVKTFESCRHTFCEPCIKYHIASSSCCYQCKQFYCFAEEKTLSGTMKSYYRDDIQLEGTTGIGAIFIVYDFPAGFQKVS